MGEIIYSKHCTCRPLHLSQNINTVLMNCPVQALPKSEKGIWDNVKERYQST